MPDAARHRRNHVPANGTLRRRVSEELLPRVRQPAQYIGGEVNQLAQPGDWERADVRVAVAFPDTYTIGMSHLGCQILYWQCNHTPGVCAERVYHPWVDAEQAMRERRIPLFTWDTRQPVASADILAVSLQYELCFTSVLNVLDLAGIPVHAADRTDDHPLVIAGGPQADNPEPMADFLDLVVIGDGEHPLRELIAAYRALRNAGAGRTELILALARQFPWLYAPNLYEIAYHQDGTIANLVPQYDGLPQHIERARTPDLAHAPFPTRPLVPWVEAVHDRISIEIMRGCPQVCRFCHAGYTKRPLSYRSVDQILEIAEQAYQATGHDEIGLLSLSTADYPHLRELAEKIHERFSSRMVNLSFPSLRIDKMLHNIPWMANAVRKGGITMAVEAAHDDLRAAIRKKVTDGNLLDGVREIYKAGWKRVKLYFMAGFPYERDADIFGIWEIANAVSLERTKLGKPPAQVNASVGWLVPKPFTPLQWMAQPRLGYFLDVQRKLKALSRQHRGSVVVTGQGGFGSANEMKSEQSLFRDPRNSGGKWQGRKSAVRITMHDPHRSILEGVFSRGDRRLGRVIYHAWQHGARLDGWDETFSWQTWQNAFAHTNVDPDFYAHRPRRLDEVLPWDHIGLHMSRDYLERSFVDLREKLQAASRPAAP